MANQARVKVRTLCQVLGVSASGYYAWRDRGTSRRTMDNAVMTERIRKIHADSDATYGMPRVRAELIDEGVIISRKRVAHLMRRAQLRGVSRRRGWVVTTQRDMRQRPAPDLVNRQFIAGQPNRLWVADMTYVPTCAGFLYLAVVLDVWSRRVVGWAIGEQMTADLVLSALNMAIAQRRPNNVIHHSDQGSSTPALRSATAAGRWACAHRWEPSATPTTTPWPKASLLAWSANSSTGAASAVRPTHAWRCLAGSKAGTTRAADTPHSTINHR
jgi:putative transposase